MYHQALGDVDWNAILSAATQTYSNVAQIRAVNAARQAAAASVPIVPPQLQPLPAAPVRIPLLLPIAAGLGAAAFISMLGGRRRGRR